MKYDAVIEHYKKPAAVAAVLDISVSAVCQWEEKGIVPFHSAHRLHTESNGAVPLVPEHYGPGGKILVPVAA